MSIRPEKQSANRDIGAHVFSDDTACGIHIGRVALLSGAISRTFATHIFPAEAQLGVDVADGDSSPELTGDVAANRSVDCPKSDRLVGGSDDSAADASTGFDCTVDLGALFELAAFRIHCGDIIDLEPQWCRPSPLGNPIDTWRLEGSVDGTRWTVVGVGYTATPVGEYIECIFSRELGEQDNVIDVARVPRQS